MVKTEVMTGSDKVVEDYEYTAHSSLVHSLDIPLAKFHFEPSPMQVLQKFILCTHVKSSLLLSFSFGVNVSLIQTRS